MNQYLDKKSNNNEHQEHQEYQYLALINNTINTGFMTNTRNGNTITNIGELNEIFFRK